MNDEWFQRILRFNQRSDYRTPHSSSSCLAEELTDDMNISAEFDSLLFSIGVSVRPFKCSGFWGINYAWCSNWDAYMTDPSVPVLYIDAHYDVVWKDMIKPFLQPGTDIVVASCHDNRASCNVLCKAIECDVLSFREDCVVYALFSDGEERCMQCIREWYTRTRTPHEKERYVVMDVTDCPSPENSPGRGVYAFDGDPIERYVDTETDQITQQTAIHREPYPGGLYYTHAGVLYNKFNCTVSRIGIPVGATSLHTSHTTLSLADLDGYYRKLCKIVKSIEF
jgi:hypothetical protein